MAGDSGRHGSNANARADVAHQIEQAGGIAHLFFRNGIVGDGSQWHKQQSHRRALQQLWPEDVPITGIQIQLRQEVQAVRTDDQATRQKFARLDLRHEHAHNRHEQERSQTARQHSHACFKSGISHQRLQPYRNQYGAAIEHKAEHRHQEHTCTVGAYLEHLEVDDRIARHQLTDHKEDQPGHRQNGKDQHEVRGEPVFFLALIEKHLQCANTEGEEANAPVIHPPSLLPDVRRIPYK